jgi:hypothetical protein
MLHPVDGGIEQGMRIGAESVPVGGVEAACRII